MAIIITQVEDAILARLQAALTRAGQPHPVVQVQAWPARPSDFRLLHPVGAVLVIYKGSTFSNAKAMAGQMVDGVAEFEIAVSARNLRNHKASNETDLDIGTGIYDLLQTVRTNLLGWRMDVAAGAVQVVKESFASHIEGVWTYILTVRVALITVINAPDAAGPYTNVTCDTAPPLTQITFDHPQAFFDKPY